MLSDAEVIVERRRLKRKLTAWRVAAVIFLLGAATAFIGWAGGLGSFEKYEDHIARVRIDGFISGDQPTLDVFAAIAKSNRVKGVILRIDSPGGSTAGSEALYDAIRKVAKDKPVVAVMDTVAASGGYVTAIAADHIVARGNTVTGSIGVIFQWPEVTKLMETLGVRMEEIKSGELKAEPNPFKPLTEKVREVSRSMVMDGYAWFTGLVAERRKLSLDRVRLLADGRAYTGRQALAQKLIDEIGGEEKATDWLNREKKVPVDTRIVDWVPDRSKSGSGIGVSLARAALAAVGLSSLLDRPVPGQLDGLQSVWQPHLQ